MLKSLKLAGALFLAISLNGYAQNDSLTLEKIFLSSEFRMESIYGVVPVKGTDKYSSITQSENGSEISLFSFKTGEIDEVLVRALDLTAANGNKQFDIDDYSISDNRKQVLLSTESEPIYRHSSRSSYFVYDVKGKTLQSISDKKVMLATLSPTGKMVAYVLNNNLYVFDIEKNKSTQLTTDGEFNKIINGASDWVYEEEFAFDKAFEWNANGTKIAYYKFDESAVKEFNMIMYDGLYPSDYRYKYPKAGEENSKVSLWISDIESGKSTKTPIDATWEYIPRIKWTQDPDLLSVQVMNRLQNQSEFLLVNAAANAYRLVFRESSKTYLEVHDNLKFLSKGEYFLWSSEKDGFNHAYIYRVDGKNSNQITGGNWDIDAIVGFDEAKDLLYYTSTEVSPLERHLYTYNQKGDKKCLSTKPGVHKIIMSDDLNYYMDFVSQAGAPIEVSLHKSDGTLIKVLKDNSKLKSTLSTYALGQKQFISCKTADGTSLNGYTILPPNFNESKKYPVLMFVYGGPGSQMVKNEWDRNLLWYQYLAQQGYIVACFDNRGTGGRGRDFRSVTYKQLGNIETQDQISAAKYLASLEYVDAARIGIWGWSYGGYMSTLCLEKGADVFKAAIAVAPVTNWRYYDSIYTERYMGLPKDNAKGYDDNSPINHVEKIKGKYLLIHGTADDNVHFQNSVELVDGLINNGIQFETMYYPNKNHSIYGGNTRFHLYSLMTNFILENL